MSKFHPKSGFKWIDPNNFDSNKYSSNNFKNVLWKLILNILKNYVN